MEIIGNGKMGMCCAQLIVTGNSGNIPSAFTVMNKTNFSTLSFNPQFDGLIDYDENTGIFTLKYKGYLWMAAALNLQASVAMAEIRLIPEFDQGEGFVPGAGKKTVLWALMPSQIEWGGLKRLEKDSKIRFLFSAISGNITFQTETFTPERPDCTIPAAIFFLQYHPCRESLVV